MAPERTKMPSINTSLVTLPFESFSRRDAVSAMTLPIGRVRVKRERCKEGSSGSLVHNVAVDLRP